MFPSTELLSVNLDKLPTSNLRTDDELKRFTLDETLEGKPIDKAQYLLSVGEDIQRLSVINSLSYLYKYDPAGCMQKVISRLQQGLPGSSTEYHLSYCAAIRQLLGNKLIPIDNFNSIFLPTILSCLEHRDSQVVDAWAECLVNLIPMLPLSVLSREVKPVAISKAAPSKPVFMRAQSCKLIGALCKKLTGAEVDKDLIPVIVPLWRDPSPEVRAAMICQLPALVRAVGTVHGTDYIVGPFVQLVSDELPKVGAVAFGAMVESIPYFTVDHLRESIWPLLREILNQAFKSDPSLMLVVAEQFGKMVTGMERAIPVSEKDIYVKHYISILDKSSDKQSRMRGMNRMSPELCATCRKHCAANYKDMAKFAYNESNKVLLDLLHVALGDMINDHYTECRKAIASNMLEIIYIYGKYNFTLKKEVNRLLSDNHTDVVEGILPNLAQILVLFAQSGYYQKDQEEPQSSDLLKVLERCESNLIVGYNWRSYCKFINQLEVIWYIFTPDIVYNKFVDLFFKRLMTQKVVLTRIALLRAILVNMKYLPRTFYKSEAKNKILEFSVSPNFYDRLIFLKAMEIVIEIHSTSFFKENYLARVLQCADDSVPNIKWALCGLLPKLSPMITQTEEKILLDEALRKLSFEKDKEVMELLKKTKSELDGSPRQIFTDDAKKLEEEKDLMNLNAKQLQTYPASILAIFEPTVLGIKVGRRESSMSDTPSASSSKPTGRSVAPMMKRSPSASSTSSSSSTGSMSRGRPLNRGRPR